MTAVKRSIASPLFTSFVAENEAQPFAGNNGLLLSSVQDSDAAVFTTGMFGS